MVGRNLVNFFLIDYVISNRKYNVMIVILMLQQLRKWKVFIVFFLFLDVLN